MKILAQRDFPLEELHVLASERSVGKKLPFKGEELTVELACDEAFRGMDIVLGAAGNPIAKQFAPAIVAAGAVFVDNSSAFRMDPSVPLIVPVIGMVAIMTFVSNFNAFDVVFSMETLDGAPDYSTDLIGTLFYRYGVAGQHPVGIPEPGVGSAISTSIFFMLLCGVIPVLIKTQGKE